MTWYEKLLDTARDVAPTVAGGAAMADGGPIATVQSGHVTA